MRLALSIRQPWADLILHGWKDIENRTWRFPQKLLGERIVAGKLMGGSLEDCPDYPETYKRAAKRRGALLGEITIVDCVTASKSRWFKGPFGYVLKNPVIYRHPIPYRGQLGVFRVQGVKLPKGGRK